MSQTVEVLVNGRPVKQHTHNGRMFVEAREGTEYEISVRNSSFFRVLAVVSVDSINVVSGEIASENGAGYVIEARSSYTVKGFRTSNDNVNLFAFSKKSKSYAAKSEETGGDTSNCGVIGIRFFEEYQPPFTGFSAVSDKWNSAPYKSPPPIWPEQPYRHEWGPFLRMNKITKGANNVYQMSMNNVLRSEPSTNKTECSNSTRLESFDSFDMGTEFTGKELKDKVTTVEFRQGRELVPKDIFYASRRVLESFGVEFEKTPSVTFPSAFPKGKFCKRPN